MSRIRRGEHRDARRAAGLTLIELVVSLTLVAILSGMTAVFLRVPMQSYFVSRQRVDLTDSVELAMRHMDQELRRALPNSVRVKLAGGVTYIEFLATRGSGRYRKTVGGPLGACPGGNQLVDDGSASDNCFTTLGQLNTTSSIVPANDYVVLENPSVPPNAFSNGALDGPNKSRITAFTAVLGAAPTIESRIRMNNYKLPASPTQLFYVVSGPVTYACDGAAGRLVRYSGYPITAAQPAPPVGGTQTVIASNLAVCNASFKDAAGALMQGIVSVDITLQNTLPGGQEQETTNFMVHVPVSKAL